MTDCAEVERIARRVRAHAIRMATGGGCFLGASLSCADILVYLYTHVLRTSPTRRQDPSRDYLLLSKGHDVPALYGTLAELGYFPTARLANHLSTGDHLYWHPNRAIPGVEFHSGSLGHLVLIVDRNGFQANVATESLIPLEPLADKLASFGFAVTEIDGHRFSSLEE